MAFKILLVGLGGALGSIARFLVSNWLLTLSKSTWPVGTFVANITGCLLIGIIYGYLKPTHLTTLEWRLLLATGFCGGYTTFSAFAYENLQFLQQAQYQSFLFYVLGSVLMGVACVWIGYSIAK
jgi:fluoride exporter